MSTNERVTPFRHPQIPTGYSINYHQIRGYDSPDKWYVALYGNKPLGEFGQAREAVDACIKHASNAANSKRTWYDRVNDED